MAMQGVRNQGGRSAIAATNATTPQKKTSTQIDTTIFCAAPSPTRFATRSSVTSNKILFHCSATYSPGACPFSINCASHALYTWLARSPASIWRCHQHGTRINAEIAITATIRHREIRHSTASLPSPSERFSATRRLSLSTPHRAAFYYLLLVTNGHPARSRGRTRQENSNRECNKTAIGNNDGRYLEAWFSPRRFRRSRKRRCSGVGVLGLNATRYQSGWLRSLLSHVSVFASAFGCRATFSRIAPYGCFASLFSVLALDRGFARGSIPRVCAAPAASGRSEDPCPRENQVREEGAASRQTQSEWYAYWRLSLFPCAEPGRNVALFGGSSPIPSRAR